MVEKLTKDLLNKLINEIKKEENQKKIEIDILNPILIKFSSKIYPYIKLIFIIFSLHFILVFIILFLIIMLNYKNSINYSNG
jgi:large-conductance mechanosensitive channel